VHGALASQKDGAVPENRQQALVRMTNRTAQIGGNLKSWRKSAP